MISFQAPFLRLSQNYNFVSYVTYVNCNNDVNVLRKIKNNEFHDFAKTLQKIACQKATHIQIFDFKLWMQNRIFIKMNWNILIL